MFSVQKNHKEYKDIRKYGPFREKNNLKSNNNSVESVPKIGYWQTHKTKTIALMMLKELKEIVMKKFREKVMKLIRKNGNINKEIENLKRNQKGILKLNK